MIKIYKTLAALMACLGAASRTGDPMTDLSLRDWADLPAYHPVARHGD